MTGPALAADQMLAAMRAVVESQPSPYLTTIRIGRGVLDELKAAAQPFPILGTHHLPLGVDIIEDDTYQPGEWRAFDQRGGTISFGALPVVGATVQVEQADGSVTRMLVIKANRDEQGRIVDYLAADPTLLDMPWESPGRFHW